MFDEIGEPSTLKYIAGFVIIPQSIPRAYDDINGT